VTELAEDEDVIGGNPAGSDQPDAEGGGHAPTLRPRRIHA
jgi:hypothetical protein